MTTGGSTGSSLRDALGRLAADAPSDEGLLVGVHAASARATVRRRVLASSFAALAVVGVAVVASATGATNPAGHELVLGDPVESSFSSEPTPDDESPTVAPSATGAAASETYRGRAVTTDGEPIGGLYVYVIPGMQAYWWHRDAVARTADDGTFDIPCPEGVVLLNAFPLFKAQDGSTPNWRTTYVGGGTLLTEAHRPTCSGEPETTVVPEGAVIEGTVHPLPTCQVGAWHVRVESDPGGHIAYDQDWLQTPIRADGTFRLAGLPPGNYGVRAEWEYGYGGGSGQAVVTGPGIHELDLAITDTACGGTAPVPASETPTAEPEASAPAEPEVTPTPGPEAS